MSARQKTSNPRLTIFYSTWFLYAAYYFCRRDTGKLPELVSGTHDSLGHVAQALALFGLAYAAAQIVAGRVADRFGGAITICSGAGLSALATIALSFGLSPAMTLAVELLNGFGQGFGWSGALKLLGEAFPRAQLPRVLAWWSGSYILGGYLATFLATGLASAPNQPNYGHNAADLWISGCILGAATIMALVLLRRSLFPGALRHGRFTLEPPILLISAMYFLLKLTRYALLFWLPLYFTSSLNYSPRSAQNTASFFTLFGVAGSLFAVWFSDRATKGNRFKASALLLFLLAIVFLLHPVLCHAGPFGAVLSVSLMGMIVHGVDMLMSGIHVLEITPPGSQGRAVGLVNSIGSFGQMLSALIVTRFTAAYGWDWLFNFFVICAVLAALICCFAWRRKPLEPLVPALT